MSRTSPAAPSSTARAWLYMSGTSRACANSPPDLRSRSIWFDEPKPGSITRHDRQRRSNSRFATAERNVANSALPKVSSGPGLAESRTWTLPSMTRSSTQLPFWRLRRDLRHAPSSAVICPIQRGRQVARLGILVPYDNGDQATCVTDRKPVPPHEGRAGQILDAYTPREGVQASKIGRAHV